MPTDVLARKWVECLLHVMSNTARYEQAICKLQPRNFTFNNLFSSTQFFKITGQNYKF